MNRSLSIKVIFVFAIFAISCTARYMKYYNATRKFNKGEITKEEYQSIFNSFYRINKNNFNPSPRIKYIGSYVCSEYSEFFKKNDFRTLKFTDSGVVFSSIRFYDSLTNEMLKNTKGVKEKYTTINDTLKLEYLLFRDQNLYNIFEYAKISLTGDTITFFKTENYQLPNKINEKKEMEVFIYHPELTENPIISM